MKELSKGGKLDVIKTAIALYKEKPTYLCNYLAYSAYRLKYIDSSEYSYPSDTIITGTLIPEFLKFKPEGLKADEWFGSIEEGRVTRLDVLHQLYDNIKNNSNE
jgi:hypothetical protein